MKPLSSPILVWGECIVRPGRGEARMDTNPIDCLKLGSEIKQVNEVLDQRSDQKIRGDQQIKNRDQLLGSKKTCIPDLAKFKRMVGFSWLRNDHKLLMQYIFHWNVSNLISC